MIRKIIHIEEEKCNGCGLCAEACHEGAIGIVGGKARLLRDDYCDGLGDCLPACPVGAISFVEREAEAYNEAAVLKNKEEKGKEKSLLRGCSGSSPHNIHRKLTCEDGDSAVESRLTQWPVQIKLAPVNAAYFNGCNLLIAADCTAYAYGDFHREFMEGKETLIGCPKLDAVDYTEKLTEIFRNNEIRSVVTVRMEVPCCGGIQRAVADAVQRSGKKIPVGTVVISTDGKRIK